MNKGNIAPEERYIFNLLIGGINGKHLHSIIRTNNIFSEGRAKLNSW